SLTTLWNQFVTFGFPAIAIAALALQGGREKTLGLVALAGLLIVVLLAAALVTILWSPASARRLGDRAAQVATGLKRVVHRGPVRWTGNDVVSFRAQAIELLRNSWPTLTLATIINQLAVFAVLLVAMRALDVSRSEVDVVEAFAAWSLIRALGSIPITPGGVGVEEVALSGALVGFGAHNAEAVAATPVYPLIPHAPTLFLRLPSPPTPHPP